MKKLIMMILTIIIFFILFLVIYMTPREYEKDYSIRSYKVTEKYSKNNKSYLFTIKYKNNNFEFINYDGYKNKRNLISDIELVKKENFYCIKPISKYMEFDYLCYKDDQIIGNIIDSKIKTLDKEYKNIKINYLNDKKIYIWNYKGFNSLNKEEFSKINILKNDIYNPELITQVNNYLVVPDYDNDYSFRSLYIINTKNNKVKELKSKYEIYFDSYVLGTYKKSVFIYDNKTETEYEIRPDLLKLRKVKYKTLEDGKLKKATKRELNNQIKFENKNLYNYYLDNNKLYLKINNNPILISENKVRDIIYQNNDEVYYLVDDSLYFYSPSKGEIELLTYFEWNFNYLNTIFIYE